MLRRLTPGVVVGFFVGSLLACRWDDGHERDDDNFRADVIACEDALARLVTCCPRFDAKPVRCEYLYESDEGCGSTTTDSTAPALDEAESRCVRETGCDELVASGVCERAQAARARETHVTTEHADGATTTSGTPATAHEQVCP
ncbi:MAG: hypothetical protein JWP97_5052 [Labilithrix sp.]|nr:hypothetical protein [Labilithrix sp.]